MGAQHLSKTNSILQNNGLLQCRRVVDESSKDISLLINVLYFVDKILNINVAGLLEVSSHNLGLTP